MLSEAKARSFCGTPPVADPIEAACRLKDRIRRAGESASTYRPRSFVPSRTPE
jgi:hypothetical protein